MAPVSKPWILAHRGASGYRPEHTLAAYQLAVDLGADFVEPDVVSTADGMLVARHENEIGGTTDVAAHPEFTDRRTTKVVDGTELTGWFTEDFTLAELKRLRAVERIPRVRQANRRYDSRFEIATLEEILDLLDRNNNRREHRVEVCVEIKHSTYFASLGLALEQPVLDCLGKHGLDGPDTLVESMETANLRALASRTSATLVQLFMAKGQPYDLAVVGDPRTYLDLTAPAELAQIATYAHAIGVQKSLVVPRDGRNRLLPATSLAPDAHAEGLSVVVWTLRDENAFLPAELRRGAGRGDKGDALTEFVRFFDAGVDGVFTDHPDTGLEARRGWLQRRSGPGRGSLAGDHDPSDDVRQNQGPGAQQRAGGDE